MVTLWIGAPNLFGRSCQIHLAQTYSRYIITGLIRRSDQINLVFRLDRTGYVDVCDQLCRVRKPRMHLPGLRGNNSFCAMAGNEYRLISSGSSCGYGCSYQPSSGTYRSRWEVCSLCHRWHSRRCCDFLWPVASC